MINTIMYYPPYNRKKFVLFLVSLSEKVARHLDSLDKELFIIEKCQSIDEAASLVIDVDHSVIIADKNQHKHLNALVENSEATLMLVTDDELNLKDHFFTAVPLNYFVGEHTVEFIFVALEKTYLRRELAKQRKRREKFCEIIKRFEELRTTESVGANAGVPL